MVTPRLLAPQLAQAWATMPMLLALTACLSRSHSVAKSYPVATECVPGYGAGFAAAAGAATASTAASASAASAPPAP